jgi:hypothetical protein
MQTPDASATENQPAPETKNKAQAIQIISLDQLVQIIRADSSVDIQFGGQLVRVRVRGISGKQWGKR